MKWKSTKHCYAITACLVKHDGKLVMKSYRVIVVLGPSCWEMGGHNSVTALCELQVLIVLYSLVLLLSFIMLLGMECMFECLVS